MFEWIHETRKKSNAFVRDLDLHIADVIEDSKETIIKLNQKQLQESKLATGQSITPLYSAAYAKRKGYNKPDGYLTGEMYREMDVITNESAKTYGVVSFAEHTRFFVDRYKEVFGVMPTNRPTAQSVAVPKLLRLYERLVL